MRITKLETIRLLEFPNILWVRVHGEDGLYGLGETFMAAAAVEAFLHEIVAPRILGTDAHAIDLIASKLYGYLGFRSTGVETRAASGNPFVDRLGAIVSAVLEVSFRLQRRSLLPMALGLAMHERVLDAIRARDAEGAGRAMHEIIEEARIELAQATGAPA